MPNSPRSKKPASSPSASTAEEEGRDKWGLAGGRASGACRAAVEAHLPGTDIVFDKFHLISNLGEVIDKVRRRTQAQADAEGRAFLKGQRYNLLRNPENVSADGRRQLDTLLAANRDLSVVYLLKDAFKAVWTYTYRRSADKCLTHWIAMALESGVGELARFARGLTEAKEIRSWQGVERLWESRWMARKARVEPPQRATELARRLHALHTPG